MSSSVAEIGRSFRPRPEAVLLLSEIMARLHGVEMPVVQFIQAESENSDASVAVSFAQASAVCLGRTLLIEQRSSETSRQPSEDAASILALKLRQARKAPDEPLNIVPDTTVVGLYHARFGGDLQDALQMMHATRDTWLEGVTLDFRLIVIESGAPKSCPSTLDLATRCHGSVLVVTAGATTLSQARRVVRQVQLAGGTILGSVLQDAPAAPGLRVSSLLKRLRGTIAR